MGRDIKLNKDFVMFTVGAIIGSAVSWTFLKKKYEDRVKQEVASVKEALGMLRKKENDAEIKKEEIDDSAVYKPTKDDLATLQKTIETNGYRDYSTRSEEEKKVTEPYVITPNEFDEIGHKTQSLIYWADKIVTDDDGNVIDDYETRIGDDALNHFGEYEEDSVYVRNDEEETDYEILLDLRNYRDVYGIDQSEVQ